MSIPTKLHDSDLRALLEHSMAQHQQGQLAEAISGYQEIVRSDPQHYDALHMLGVALLQQCAWQEALSYLQEAQNIHDQQATLHFHLGLVYFGLEQFDAAIAAFTQVINTDPSILVAYSRRAEVYSKAKRYQEALADVHHLLSVQTTYDDLHLQGDLYIALKQYDKAVASYQQALDIQPTSKTWNNMGNAYKQMADYEKALESYHKAKECGSDYLVELHYNIANIYKQLNRFTDAHEQLQQLFGISTTFAKAWFLQGIIYKEFKKFDKATEAFSQAIALDEEMDYVVAEKIAAEMRLCNWSSWDEVEALLTANSRSFSPFLSLSLTDNPALQLKISQDYCIHHFATHDNPFTPISTATSASRKRIRIGYFSADFRNHALSFLMAGIFESHDRNQFEIHLFSYGIPTKDLMRQRLEKNSEYFHDVFNQTNFAIVEKVRAFNLHIAVDLTGQTSNNRMDLFAHHLAPIQISYLGYPGTSGAQFMNYIIGDSILVPKDQQHNFQEKIIYMPDTFQANDHKRVIGSMKARSTYGIPQNALIFANFNNSYKINPDVFDAWMSILNANPRIVLWLLRENQTQVDNLKNAARVRGVSSDRLYFGEHMDYALHLARFAHIDLILDTFPFTGGTSTSDALWGGAPVLTVAGLSFTGRMSTSLLTTCKMESLICTTVTDYVQKAVDLSNNPQQLLIYKKHLALNKRQMTLFDTPRFTKHLEHAYLKTVERYQQGLPPAAIVVESIAENTLPSV